MLKMAAFFFNYKIWTRLDGFINSLIARAIVALDALGELFQKLFNSSWWIVLQKICFVEPNEQITGAQNPTSGQARVWGSLCPFFDLSTSDKHMI